MPMGAPLLHPATCGSFQPYQVSHDRSHLPSVSPQCEDVPLQFSQPCPQTVRYPLDHTRPPTPNLRCISSEPTNAFLSAPMNDTSFSSSHSQESSGAGYADRGSPQDRLRWIDESVQHLPFLPIISDVRPSAMANPRAPPCHPYPVAQPALHSLESFDRYDGSEGHYDSFGFERLHQHQHKRSDSFSHAAPYWVVGSKSERKIKPPVPHNPDKARRHVCPVCDKRFNRPSSLNTHMSVHTGAKPFVCDEPDCGRRFSVSSNLRRHEKTHQLHRASPPPSVTPSTSQSMDQSDAVYASVSPPLPYLSSTPFSMPGFASTSTLSTPSFSYPAPLAPIPVEYAHHPQLLTPLPTGAGTGELEQYRLAKPPKTDERAGDWSVDFTKRTIRV